MPLRATDLIGRIRPYLRRQKRNLTYRFWNPLRYCVELTWAIFNDKSATSTKVAAGRLRVALVSDLEAPSSEQQFYPFSTYRKELRSQLHLHSIHLMLKDVLLAPRLILSPFDIVILKLSYRTNGDEAMRIVQLFRNSIGRRKLIYFDGDDDVCIQWAEILPYFDLYVKKHAFRDRALYLKKYVGKSNLTDYVVREFNHVITTREYGNPWDKQVMISESGPISRAYLDKVIVGVDLVEDSVISNLYEKVSRSPNNFKKEFDIIFRGSVTRETIVYHLRSEIEPILRGMESEFSIIIPNRRVSRDEYYSEMMKSKICVSPFGYGEICWRDYEAILCRSLLIKPNMGHIETIPDIFQAYKTYVPVHWDFSDLREKCEYYLRNDTERETIIDEAYRVVEEFYKNRGFIESMSSIIKRAGVDFRGDLARGFSLRT